MTVTTIQPSAHRHAWSLALTLLGSAACGDAAVAPATQAFDAAVLAPDDHDESAPATHPNSPAGADAGGEPTRDPAFELDAALSAGADGSTPQAPAQGSGSLAGLEFFQRIAGKWSGKLTSHTSVPGGFSMEVDFTPSSDSMLFGKFVVIPQLLTVVWGFNIESYDAKGPVLAYRNGGFLFGAKRDSRTQLVQHDAQKGVYRFCAVKESGVPGFGCNWIEATYTFSDENNLVFEVSTLGEPHIRWDARRVQKHSLPQPFPATTASQGDGSAPWPAAAEL